MIIRSSFLFLVFFIASFNSNGQVIDNYNSDLSLDYSLIPYCENKLCGYVDNRGNPKIKADYDAVSFFNEKGFAQVKKFGLFGVIDKDGKEIVKPISSKPLSIAENLEGEETPRIENAFFAINTKAKEWIYFRDAPTVFVSPNYFAENEKYQYKFSNALYAQWSHSYFYEGIRRAVSKDGTCNFINIEGKPILKQNIPYGAPSKDAIYTIDESNKIGALNLQGEEIISKQYDYLEHMDKWGYRVATVKSKKGILDNSNKFVIDTVMITARPIGTNKFIISKTRNEYQLVDKNLNSIFTKTYTQIKPYLNNLYAVKEGSNHYVINEKEEVLSGPFKTSIQFHKYGNDSKYMHCKSGDSTYVMGNNGKTIFSSDIKYNLNQGNKENNIVLSNRDHGSLLINTTGKILLEPGYKNISKSRFLDSYLVHKGIEMGLYSEERGWIIPLGLHQIGNYSDSKNPDIPKLKVETAEIVTEYTGDLSNKLVKENKFQNWGVNRIRNKEFIELKFPDGREAIFPKDKDANLEYTSKHAYLKKRFDRNSTQVFDENMESLIPAGFSLNKDYKIKSDVFFAVQNKQREIGLTDFEGNWIFTPAPNQRIQNLQNKYWITGDFNSSVLYNSTFKQLSTKEYKGFALSKLGLIIAHNKDGKTLDVLDENGRILNEELYTGLVRNDLACLVLEKSKTGEIQSCQIDENGNEIICYAYADFYIPEDHVYIVAKDLHDFGVVDKQGKQMIPFKYKSINYSPDIKSYICRMQDYSTDVYDYQFKQIVTSQKGLYKTENIEEKFYYFQGSEKTFIFENNGALLGITDNTVNGKMSTRGHHLDQGLLWIYKSGGGNFFSTKAKKILSPN